MSRIRLLLFVATIAVFQLGSGDTVYATEECHLVCSPEADCMTECMEWNGFDWDFFNCMAWGGGEGDAVLNGTCVGYCGDDLCNAVTDYTTPEDYMWCPGDCAPPGVECGDGVCNEYEQQPSSYCYEDCDPPPSPPNCSEVTCNLYQYVDASCNCQGYEACVVWYDNSRCTTNPLNPGSPICPNEIWPSFCTQCQLGVAANPYLGICTRWY